MIIVLQVEWSPVPPHQDLVYSLQNGSLIFHPFSAEKYSFEIHSTIYRQVIIFPVTMHSHTHTPSKLPANAQCALGTATRIFVNIIWTKTLFWIHFILCNPISLSICCVILCSYLYHTDCMRVLLSIKIGI